MKSLIILLFYISIYIYFISIYISARSIHCFIFTKMTRSTNNNNNNNDNNTIAMYSASAYTSPIVYNSTHCSTITHVQSNVISLSKTKTKQNNLSSSSSYASSLHPSSSSFPLRIASFNIGLGFIRKLPSLLTRCSHLSLDIIALQEIGSPALTKNEFNNFTLIHSSGPTAHQSGVGFLVANKYLPRLKKVIKYDFSQGRLIGLIFEFKKGKQILFISSYMPSGIDHLSSENENISLSHKLYKYINK
jgi:hypothetical protein